MTAAALAVQEPDEDLARALAEVGASPVPSPEACILLASVYLDRGDAVRAARWAFAATDADDPAAWTRAGRIWKKVRSRITPPPRRARVAVLGGYTTSQFCGSLSLAAARAGVEVDLYEAGFGQYQRELVDPDSGLHRFRPEVVVLAVSAADVALPELSPDPDHAVAAELSRWTTLWDQIRQLGARVIQHTIAIPADLALGHLAGSVPGSRYAMLHRLNAGFAEQATDAVSLVDCDRLAGLVGKRTWFDPRYFFLAKQAVSLHCVPLLARHTAAVLAAGLGASKKCLVLDLDNTLWGGILGEDGAAGIAIGHGPVGEAYTAFQRYVLELKRKGVVLAVCSKNNPDDVRAVFSEHPDMLIRLDDIAVLEAGWEDKPTVVRRIATTLDIGLDALVFVDDNPAEREAVRDLAPGVDVIALPAEPAGYVSAVSAYPFFETSSLTQEDSVRTDQYRARAEAATLQSKASTLEEFLASLDMRVEVSPLAELTIPRASQLIGKTNQWNLTGRRHSQPVVAAMAADPEWVSQVVRLTDRFADHGIIGVLLARQEGPVLDIDTWLLSCRVIGRNVEHEMLRRLRREAGRRGCSSIRGTYVALPKNAQVADLYAGLGFRADGAEPSGGATRWQLDLDGSAPDEQELSPALAAPSHREGVHHREGVDR